MRLKSLGLLLFHSVLAIAGTIPNTQPINESTAFIGQPATPNTLTVKIPFFPSASLMHEDSGNTGSTDYPGPLGGSNMSLFSQQIVTGVMTWGTNNTMTIGYANSTTLARGIAAIDPQTMEILATWTPPDSNQTLSLGYLEYLLETDEILFTSQEGHVYLIRRDDDAEKGTAFTTVRNIDLTTIPAAIADGESLLNAMMDTAGNIWYTTGGIPGIGSLYAAQTSVTLGYITPDNQVHSIQMDGQTIENGIAVSNTTAYVVTGPTTIGTEGVPQVGYMLALTSLPFSGDAGSNGGVRTLWNATYDAGSTTKLGAITRGSGSTPALLGDDYVVITDNADGRINLAVYYQGAIEKDQLLCTVPLFGENASANDLAATTHYDVTTGFYTVVVENTFNGTTMFWPNASSTLDDINGGWNNMAGMPGGTFAVQVSADASGNSTAAPCSVRWTSPMTVKANPVLSTKTGLLYFYTQDEKLADEGMYVWYVVALDWRSGAEVWRARMGSGGAYNDNWLLGGLGPDGTYYQAMLGGLAAMKDGSN
uniref:Uncharacterized protein n=1 Tax=Colletotrichum fructicola (strain Nara gc5) TaxID=1213859 RepID=L2FY83_COLFN